MISPLMSTFGERLSKKTGTPDVASINKHENRMRNILAISANTISASNSIKLTYNPKLSAKYY